MNGHRHWRRRGGGDRLTESDRRALLLLVHLPLIWRPRSSDCTTARRASVYRGLADSVPWGLSASCGRRSGPEPWPALPDRLRDRVAADQRVDRMCWYEARLRGTDLADRLPACPAARAHDLLASVAVTHWPIDLLAWGSRGGERSFARRDRRLRSRWRPRGPVVGRSCRAFLLLPDLATSPLGVTARCSHAS
jgi:hypothetical protein